MTNTKPIGYIGITNTASLFVYEFNEYEEKVLVGLNDEKPRWRKMYMSGKGIYFRFGGSRYYLHEILRTSL